MKIEKFNIEKYEEVFQLWKKTGISIGSSDSPKELKKMLKNNPELCLVGIINEMVVGVVMGGFDGRRGYVHHLAIDPKFQKQGLGKLLISELLKRFKKKGVHKIHLFVEKRNLDVINFYKKIGWQIREDLIMMSFVSDKKLYKHKI